MASGITHMLLAGEFSGKLGDQYEEYENLKDLLDQKLPLFHLGAVAPDLPYASLADLDFFSDESSIADLFHYEDTNQLPVQALKKIKIMTDEAGKESCLAFFLGYISHIVADGIIHPFVRDKVGDYESNAKEHRALEMGIDVLYFADITNASGTQINLRDSEINEQIKNVFNDKNFDQVMALFSETIKSVYKNEDTKDLSAATIKAWIKSMERMFEAAQGAFCFIYKLPAVSEVSQSFIFQDIKDILKKKDNYLILEKAKDRENNFLNRKVHFIEDCVPLFHRVLADILQNAYNYIYSDASFSEKSLPAINLDTGRLLSDNKGKNLDKKPFFWEGVS